MPEPEDLLDALLDRALEARRPPDPRAGLEERVVATLRSAPPRAQGLGLAGWLRPLAAGLAFAVLALVLVRARQTAGPAARGAAAHADGPPASAAAVSPEAPRLAPRATPPPATATAAALSRPVVSARRWRPVRPATFPAASPLGEQERLLLRYVTGTPREELEARAGFLDDPVTLPSIDDTTSSP